MRIFNVLQQRLKLTKKRSISLLIIILFLSYLASSIFHTFKPLPTGLNMQGEIHPISSQDVQFLADTTYIDAHGHQHVQSQIFPKMLELIRQARTTIVLDSFLFSPDVGQLDTPMPNQVEQIVQALLQKKREYPDIAIYIMTDPINSLYGSILPQHYITLRNAGISVEETNLTPLRSPNPLWSGFWYICCQSLNSTADQGWITSPMSDDKMTLTSYLQLFNLRANHRKILVTDSEQGWYSLISSANLHDGSAKHSNSAILIKGEIAQDVLTSETAVANLSNSAMPLLVLGKTPSHTADGQIQLLTEQAIYHKALDMIQHAQAHDQIRLMMFYLSERNIIQALKHAQQRGVNIQILLDPNKNAFGRQKNGLPNQVVAQELHQAGIPIRWCYTVDEQCHSKLLMVKYHDHTQILTGSANFTARNLKNYNLESDIWLKFPHNAPMIQTIDQLFTTAWRADPERKMSEDITHHINDSTWHYWQYRFMEWSGLSTF